jgi:hypothetical protein
MVEDQTKNTLEAAQIYYYGRATTWAGGRLLTVPLRSRVVQGLLEKSEAAAEYGDVAAMAFVDYKLGKAGLATLNTRLDGGCYASFLPPSIQ